MKYKNYVKEEETVHIRLIGEDLSITERLNYVPIIPKNNTRQTKNDFDVFDNYWDYSDCNREIKKWDIDRDSLNSFFKPTTQPTKFNQNYQVFEGKEVWISKLPENKKVDDETIKEHYGILTSSVYVDRIVFIFSETSKHYKFTTYNFNKKRKSGFRHFKTRREITSIILNKITGDVYIRNARFNQRKWKIKLRKNPLHSLINEFSNYIPHNGNNNKHKESTGIEEIFDSPNQVYVSNQNVDKIAEILGIDISMYDTVPYPYSQSLKYGNLNPSPNQRLSMVIVLWFLKTKQIKYPNNPFQILGEHYPKIKSLRKNDMNLVHATLSSFGIKSGATIKIFNQNNYISCFDACFWFHFLGHDYSVQLGPAIFQNNNINLKYQITRMLIDVGLEMHNLTDLVNSPDLWNKINSILTKQEKYKIFCILRSSIINKNKMPSLGDIFDHLRIKKELLEFDDNVKIKSKTSDEFYTEHVQWSDKLYQYKKDKTVRYAYLKTFLELIEQPVTVPYTYSDNETFYPVVLKEDIDYFKESEIQNHCVKTYVNSYKSIIISIRKGDINSLDRITCEYRFNENNKTFNLIQKKAKNNEVPNDSYTPVLKNIDMILSNFADNYKPPKVLEINKRTNQPKLLTANNEVEDDFFDL